MLVYGVVIDLWALRMGGQAASRIRRLNSRLGLLQASAA
jgi:hypothetical protein